MSSSHIANLAKHYVVIMDNRNRAVIGQFPANATTDEWKPWAPLSTDAIAGKEWQRLVDARFHGANTILLITYSKETELNLSTIELQNGIDVDAILKTLKKYVDHLVQVSDQPSGLDILIGDKDPSRMPLREFSVHCLYHRIFKRLVIVDYEQREIIAEVPSPVSGASRVWLEPTYEPYEEPDNNRIIGILTSEDSLGSSRPEVLGLISEYDEMRDAKGAVNVLDPEPPEGYVSYLELPSIEDAEAAKRLLAPLVGNAGVRATSSDDGTLELLLMPKYNVDLIKQVS